jgi:uncharacterized protein with ACT and thioredoxin-like domain
MAAALYCDPLRACVPLPVRTKPDASSVEMGDIGQRDRRRIVGHRIAAAVLVRGELRELQCNVRITRCGNRLHGVDVVLHHLLLVGGEINAEMEHQTAKDTTEGRKRPMGSRGAKMADELGEART